MAWQRRVIIVVNLTLSVFQVFIGFIIAEKISREAIHVQINDAHLIEFGRNFALSSPLLMQKTGWKSVNLNGDNVLSVTPDCRYSIKQYNSLTIEQREALAGARQQFDDVDKRLCLTRYSLSGHLRASSSCRGQVSPTSLYHNGSSIVGYDKRGDNISVASLRRDFPKNIRRLFIDMELATFLHKDGRLRMRPIACLQSSQVRLVEQAREEAGQVAKHQKSSQLDSQVAGNGEILHLQLNEAHLIGTEPGKFALTGPALQRIGWKTVSFKGKYLLFFSDTCEHSVEHFDSLEPGEQVAVLEAKELADPKQQVYRSAWSRYSLSSAGGHLSMSMANNISLVSFDEFNGSLISKYDNSNNLSMSRADLPNGMARIFVVNGDVAGFVFADGQVIMIPVHCLEPMGAHLIERLKREAPLAEEESLK